MGGHGGGKDGRIRGWEDMRVGGYGDRRIWGREDAGTGGSRFQLLPLFPFLFELLGEVLHARDIQ